MKQSLFSLLLLYVAYSCSTTGKNITSAEEVATNEPEVKTGIQESEILWDTWGVPHIYATNEDDLYFGMGWAQMRNHGDLLMKLYAEGRGEGPKYFGESALPLAQKLINMGIPQLGRDSWNDMTSSEKEVLNAFVNGINSYAEAHPNHIDAKLRGVLPIQPSDVNAHALRNFFIEFIGNQELGTAMRTEIGSNTWAISPERSESGNAMLLANPHLQYDDLWLFFESHLITDDYSIYGSTLVGMPTMGIAFNEHLGWSHTVNTLDAADLYRLKLDGDGYVLDGEKKAFDVTQHKIEVLQEDGSMKEVDFTSVKSVHGPVVRKGEGEAIALRIARMDKPGHMIQQWKDMGEATSLSEFQAVLAKNDLPMFNVMYADKAGNIFYHFGGYIPERVEKTWDFWSGIVPGDDSQYLWDSYHSYEELPKLLNPKSGWLQNANDPPYTCTIPLELNPNDFPAYMSPHNMAFRPQRSANIMMADSKVSFEELESYKHDTKMELADRLLDDLLALESESNSDLQKEALEVLKSWDGNANVDSKGALLFANWHMKITQGNLYSHDFFKEKWSEDDPVNTPDGLADPASALQALEVAANELKTGYGRLDVPWGDVNRVSFGDHDVAGNGGYGWLGEFRTMYYQPMGKPGTPESLKSRAIAGDTYVAIIEFDERPRAKALLTYGNATQKGNPHIGDQLDLFSQKKLRDVWYEREDVEANMEKREKIITNN